MRFHVIYVIRYGISVVKLQGGIMYSIPQLANECGVAGNTIRRHLERYSIFFQGVRGNDGVIRYSDDGLDLLKKIIELYKQGKNKHTIPEILKREGFEIYDETVSEYEIEEKQSVTVDELVHILKQLSDKASILKKIEAMEKDIEYLKSKIG